MNNPPRVGPPVPDAEQHTPHCSYRNADQQPCGAPATVHLLVATNGTVATVLSSCDEHAPIARSAAIVRQEHAYDVWCDMPGAVWNTEINRCALDDSGHALAATGREVAMS